VVIAEALWLDDDWLLRWGIGTGVGYVLMVLVGLLLHYWPGPVTLWMVIFFFNLITLLGLGWLVTQLANTGQLPVSGWALAGLLLILLIGAAFRFINLGYSEFDGDEIKALVPAAEAIEGHPEALFDQRKKGRAKFWCQCWSGD
jgi:hypothetical protein